MNHVANGAKSAGAGAWVSALFAYASSIAGTVRIYGAFWSTIRRAAHVVRRTGTGRRTSDISALRIGPTGGWYTGVFDRGWQWF